VVVGLQICSVYNKSVSIHIHNNFGVMVSGLRRRSWESKV